MYARMRSSDVPGRGLAANSVEAAVPKALSRYDDEDMVRARGRRIGEDAGA